MTKQLRNKRIYYLSIIFLLVLFLFPRLKLLGVPLDRDEAEYAYSAWIMSNGQMPYEHAFIQKPPPIVYVYSLARLFDPNGYIVVRSFGLLASAASILLIMFISKKVLGKDYFIPAAWIMVPTFMLPSLTSLFANTEIFMLVPMLGAILIFFDKREKSKPVDWFLFGVLSVIACAFKMICLPVLGFLFVYWVIGSLRSAGKNIKMVLLNFIAALIGGVVATVLILLPFYRNLSFLIEAVIVYNSQYIKAMSSFPAFVGQLVHYLFSWPILWGFVLGAIAIQPKERWFWLGLFMSSLIGVYSGFTHYYILLVPILTLVAMLGIKLLFKDTKGKIFALIVLAGSLFVPVLQVYFVQASKYFDIAYGRNFFDVATEVGFRIQTLTKPEDYIYVAGTEPEIYYHAKRIDPSRFIAQYALYLDTPYKDQYQLEAQSDISSKSPEVIVVSTESRMGWLIGRIRPIKFINFLDGYLQMNYHLVSSYVQTASGGYWSESPSVEEVRQSAFVIYKKNHSESDQMKEYVPITDLIVEDTIRVRQRKLFPQ